MHAQRTHERTNASHTSHTHTQHTHAHTRARTRTHAARARAHKYTRTHAAAIVFSASGPVHLAGKLARFDPENSGLERHSYDAELPAYIDVAHHLPADARALIITDCLSGASRTAFRP